MVQKMTVKSFHRMNSFSKSQKKIKKRFFGHFWVNLGYVSHIPALRIC